MSLSAGAMYSPPATYAVERRSPVCVWTNDSSRSMARLAWAAAGAALANARDGTSAAPAARAPYPRNERRLSWLGGIVGLGLLMTETGAQGSIEVGVGVL